MKTLCMVSFAMALSACATAGPFHQDLVEAEFVVPRGDVRSVQINVEIPGELEVHSGPCSLLQARAYYDADHHSASVDYTVDASGFGKIDVKQKHRGSRWSGDQGRWDMCVTKDVPVDFSLEQGTGDVDLSGVQVRSLRVANGTGDVDLDLGDAHLATSTLEIAAGTGDVELDLSGVGLVGITHLEVETGTGDFELELPSGFAARVRVEQGTGDASIGGLEKRGDAYVTADWGTAKHGIDVTVESGTGDITVLRDGSSSQSVADDDDDDDDSSDDDDDDDDDDRDDDDDDDDDD